MLHHSVIATDVYSQPVSASWPILIFLSGNHIYFKSNIGIESTADICNYIKNSYAEFFKYNQMNFNKINKTVFSILLLPGL